MDIVFSIQPTHWSSEGLATKIYETRPKQMKSKSNFLLAMIMTV